MELISPASNDEHITAGSWKEPIDSQSVMMKNKNQSSQSKRIHHNVGIIEDLIIEILLRVPAIYVLRFKCVCKKWYSLISNPDFVRSHSTDLLIYGYHCPLLHFYKPFEFFYLLQDNLEPPLLKILSHSSPSLFPENHPQNCNLEDSCNGLLLLYFSEPNDFIGANNTYYIFNWITKHYLKLPGRNHMNNITEENFAASSHIMFDPSVSLSYKVIRCWLKDNIEIPGNMHCQCQLYSSETGSWRFFSTRVPMNSIEDNSDFESKTTLLNGVLYWSYWCTSLDVSYCFDVEKESGSFFPLPPKPVGDDIRVCLYFGECGGRLRLIEKYYVSFDDIELYPLIFPCSFDIMEMDQEHCQDGHSPWILKYHVNMEMGLNCSVVRQHPFHVEIIHCYMTKNKGGGGGGGGGEGEGEDEVLILSISQISGFQESIDQTSIMSFNLTSNTFGKELTVSKSTTSTSYDFRNFFPFTRAMFANFMIRMNEKQKT